MNKVQRTDPVGTASSIHDHKEIGRGRRNGLRDRALYPETEGREERARGNQNDQTCCQDCVLRSGIGREDSPTDCDRDDPGWPWTSDCEKVARPRRTRVSNG